MVRRDKTTRDKTGLPPARLSKEVQAKLSAFVNSSTESFVLLDENLNFMFVNPTTERMIGTSGEAVVGKNVLDVVSEVKESGRYDKYLNILRTGEPFSVEDTVFRTKFGDIHASLKAFKVGNWLGVIITDTTERKKSEKALRQSEQNYRVLFEGTLDGLFVVNAETGRIVLANRSAAKMFGFSSPEAMIGVYPINFVTPQNKDEVLRFVAEDVLRDLSEGWSRSNREATEMRALANDGREIWLEIQSTPTEYQGELAYLVSSKDITGRKRAGEALRCSEEYFRALIENAQDTIVILNGDGTLQYASPSMERIWGYKVEDWIGKDFPEFVFPDDMQNAAEIFAGLLRDPGSRIYTEIHVRHKNGSIHVVEASGKNLLDDPSIKGIVLNVCDITERKKAEEALKESEEKWRSLSESSPDHIALHDLDTTVLFMNRTAPDITKEDIIGASVFKYMPPEFRQTVADCFKRVEASGKPDMFTAVYYAKDGGTQWFEVRVGPVFKEGRVVAFISSSTNITERKKLEDELRESAEKYRNLFNNAQVGLFRSRIADGKILECNDLLAKMFGYRDREECIARHITSEHYVDPNVRGRSLAQTPEKGKVENIEALVTRKDGSPFWISYSATIYPERDCIEGVVIDITERKKAEEMLRVAEERFYKAFRASPDAITISRMADGTLIEVNDMWEKILGYSRAESVGTNTVALGVWSDPAIRRKCVKQLQKTGSLRNFETDLRRKTGELCQVSLSSERLEIEGEQCLLTIIRDITERKKADEALHFTRFALDNAGDAMVCLGQDAHYIDVNDAFCRSVGYSREELSSMTAHDIDPNYSAKIWAEFWEKLKRKGSLTFESCHRRKDGKVTPVEVTVTFFKYEGKEYHFGFARDITERKKADEAIRNERDNLLNTLNAMKDGVYIINQQNDIVFANPSTVEEFGPYEGKKCYEYFHNFEKPCSWCDSRAICAGKIVRSDWFFPKTGKTYEVVHAPFSETDGSISKLSIIRDITERKRMEDALRDSEERYRALVETSGQAGEGIIIVQDTEDREGAIVFANDEYCRITGYSKEELLNKTAWDLIASDMIPEIKEMYRRRQAGEDVPRHYEVGTVRKDGGVVPTESFMGIMKYHGKIATVAYTRDITERKRMEEALRQSEQTIRRLAKAAASAHEEERHRVSLEVHDRISQTLTGAFHQLQALESIPMENAEAQQILKRASDLLQESIHESRNIMEDLYSPVLSDFGIAAVIDEELSRFQEETRCCTRFDERCAGGLTPEVGLTAYRIFREALANIKRHAIGVTEVRVSLSCEAGVVSLQVKDNGPGFDVEVALQNMLVGGLKGMQRRAELGGGTFEVVSSRGYGTTVTVCLPCTSASDRGKEEKTT